MGYIMQAAKGTFYGGATCLIVALMWLVVASFAATRFDAPSERAEYNAGKSCVISFKLDRDDIDVIADFEFCRQKHALYKELYSD